ncbi:hypothetical protein C4G66_RS09725 [Vibrio parahaemolyticus]|nr:hypothetical protein [Vibrio parahaemolyticus]EJG1068918.1 hypothetical protein [Vibrio parahaemolyticus]
MTINLLHQAGHNSSWNRDSFTTDNVGSGIIYSPVHDDYSRISKFTKKLKKTSIFDPQFYLPSSQKPKFKTYDFFPNTILNEQGFNTIDFNSVAHESARRCVNFQKSQGFESIIIPTRFFEQLHPKYTEQQSELFVNPFLKAVKDADLLGNKDIYLTVPITSHMLNSTEYKENILNWITSYPEIDGIYFICQHDRKTKQIQDTQFLLEYMDVIYSTIDADLKVIVGYTNTESLLYSLCGDITLTVGAFENTRIFSLDKFIISDEAMRGPKPRIYLPKLLNWVNFEQAKLIKEYSPHVWKEIYTPTSYSENALSITKELTFQNPQLYKHYFISFSEQLKLLSVLNIEQRHTKLKQWINEAIQYHQMIKNIPLDLEKHGNGEHLDHWLNTINIYKSKHI